MLEKKRRQRMTDLYEALWQEKPPLVFRASLTAYFGTHRNRVDGGPGRAAAAVAVRILTVVCLDLAERAMTIRRDRRGHLWTDGMNQLREYLLPKKVSQSLLSQPPYRRKCGRFVVTVYFYFPAQ